MQQNRTEGLRLGGASILFRDLGVRRIPLAPHSKEPAFEYLFLNGEGKPTWKTPIPDEDLDKLFTDHPELNIGGMLGSPSGNLFELDFDSPEVFEKYSYRGDSFKDHTLTYSTGRGFKILARSDTPLDYTKIDFRPALPMELRGEGCYTVLPPSIHPNGTVYTVLGTWQIATLSNAKEKVMQRVRELGWRSGDTQASGTSGTGHRRIIKSKTDRELTPEERANIVNAIVPLWVRDYRNQVCMSLIGYLVKSGVRQEDTFAIIDDITTLAEDEERSSRLAQVRYHYSQRARVNLKGWSGLRSVAEALKIRGLNLE